MKKEKKIEVIILISESNKTDNKVNKRKITGLLTWWFSNDGVQMGEDGEQIACSSAHAGAANVTGFHTAKVIGQTACERYVAVIAVHQRGKVRDIRGSVSRVRQCRARMEDNFAFNWREFGVDFVTQVFMGRSQARVGRDDWCVSGGEGRCATRISSCSAWPVRWSACGMRARCAGGFIVKTWVSIWLYCVRLYVIL